MSNTEHPGADWIYVGECEELTTEQATRRFLDQEWSEQLRMMEVMREDVGAAAHCRMQNHEGAVIFATRHSCAPVEPETIAGEVVTAGAQSTPLAISATLADQQARHQHETWQIRRRDDGGRYCAACGATL